MRSSSGGSLLASATSASRSSIFRRSTWFVASGLSSLGAALKPTMSPGWRSKSTLKLSRPRLTSTTLPTPLPSMATTEPTSNETMLSKRSTFSQVFGMSPTARLSPAASTKPANVGRSP